MTVVAAMMQIPYVASPALAAPAVPGSGVNRSGCTAATAPDVQTQLTRFEDCLGKSWITTRGWGAKFPDCIADAKSLRLDEVYTRNECRGSGSRIQAEAIAHARAISRLQNQLTGRSGTQGWSDIDRRIQWEVSPRGSRQRVDIAIAPHTEAPLEFIEVEPVWMGTAGWEEGLDQVRDQYVGSWRTYQPQADQPIEHAISDALVGDRFRVVTNPGCTPGGSEARGFTYTTVKNNTYRGVLGIQRAVWPCDPADPGDDMTPDDSAACVTQVGADLDGNGRDDVYDHLASHRAEFDLEGVDIPYTVLDGDPTEATICRESMQELANGLRYLSTAQSLLDCPEEPYRRLVGKTVLTQLLRAATRGAVGGTPGVVISVGLAATSIGMSIVDILSNCGHANAAGDPHLRTLDGLRYDLQSVGEFHLVEVPSHNIDIQARFSPWLFWGFFETDSWSAVSSIAFEMGGTPVQLNGGRSGQMTVTIDGTTLALNPDDPYGTGLNDLSDGYGLVTDGKTVAALFPTGEILMASGSWVGFMPVPGTKTRGLLGDNDTEPDNDLALANGTVLASTTSPGVLHGSFADSWRITDQDSWFNYGPGQSTASFTDLAFPKNIRTVNEFPAEDREAAAVKCQAAGVPDGANLEDCVYDLLVSGDARFAADVAALPNEASDPNASSFDAASQLVEDFTSPVPVNFASTRYVNDEATSRVAGPLFDETGYSFYVNDVPRHDRVDAQLRLVTYGNVDSDALDQTVDVIVDKRPAVAVPLQGRGTTNLTDGGSVRFVSDGSTTSGTHFQVYELDLPITHSARTLNLKVVPHGFRGVQNTALGIDNVALQLTTPPAQDFSITVPAAISANAPGPGAGTLESPGALDTYAFEWASPGDLYLGRNSGAVIADLYTADGQLVTPAFADATHVRFRVLPAGSYVVRVTAAKTAVDYRLAVSRIEPDITLTHALGGPWVTPSTTTPGQNATVTFSGTTGKRVQIQTRASQWTDPTLDGAKGAMRWSVIAPDGTRIGSTFDASNAEGWREVVLPADGTYTVHIDPQGGAIGSVDVRAYAVPADADPGFYDLDNPPQNFDIAIGERVPTQDSPAGAGQLEVATAKDVYSFTVTEQSSLYLDVRRVCLDGLTWSLRRQDTTGRGTEVALGGCPDRQLEVSPGEYRITFSGRTAGKYAFHLVKTPVPIEDFELALATTVADGTPAPGAGNLESVLAVDRYSLELDAPAPLYVDFLTCTDSGQLAWKLTQQPGSEDTEPPVTEDGRGCADIQTPTLPAGSYQFEIRSTDDARGPYSFQAWPVPLPPQTWTTTLPLLIGPDSVNNEPTEGAGRLETKASVDTYSFTVPDDKTSLVVDSVTCQHPDLIRWTLTSDSLAPGVVVADGGCKGGHVNQLASGDYALTIASGAAGHGGYAMRVRAANAALPAIVHTPVLAATYKKTVTIDAVTTCASQECSATLFYRDTTLNGTNSLLDLGRGEWTRLDMQPAGPADAIEGLPARAWRATIPAEAVTTTGVDYFIEATDGDDINQFPVDMPAAPGGVGGPTGELVPPVDQMYWHISTLSPPVLLHVPPVFAHADTDTKLSVTATCSTGDCSGMLYYRESHGLVGGLVDLSEGQVVVAAGEQPWSTRTLEVEGVATDLGDLGETMTLAATIPGADVDTDGLDYFFAFTDGEVTTYWPGTPYLGYYLPLEGQQVAYQTLHVLEPPHITHVPPIRADYQEPLRIKALANCPPTRSCTATLYYRTTPVGPDLTSGIYDGAVGSTLDAALGGTAGFVAKPMEVTTSSLTALDGSAGKTIKVTANIPGNALTTAGVDYFFKISDGTTTTWWPGTGQIQGYVPIGGIRVAYHHVHVSEPPHIIPTTVPLATAGEPLTIRAAMTCVTDNCSLQLRYRALSSSGETTDDPWQTVPMTKVGGTLIDPLLEPLADLLGTPTTYEAVIPGDHVTDPGILYHLKGSDGHVTTYAPGTSYNGTLVIIDGQPVGALPVAVTTLSSGPEATP